MISQRLRGSAPADPLSDLDRSGPPTRSAARWTRSTPQPQRRCPQRSATGSPGSIPPPRTAATAGRQALDVKLAGPRSRFKTRAAVEEAATTAVKGAHAERWVTFTVTETTSKKYKQERAGRPAAATRYREILTSRFSVHADIVPGFRARDAYAYPSAGRVVEGSSPASRGPTSGRSRPTCCRMIRVAARTSRRSMA